MWFFYLQLGYDFFPCFLVLEIGLMGNPLHAAQMPMVAETDDTIFIQFGDNPAVTYHKELVPPASQGRYDLHSYWFHLSVSIAHWRGSHGHTSDDHSPPPRVVATPSGI